VTSEIALSREFAGAIEHTSEIALSWAFDGAIE